jgi:hypothetical protein
LAPALNYAPFSIKNSPLLKGPRIAVGGFDIESRLNDKWKAARRAASVLLGFCFALKVGGNEFFYFGGGGGAVLFALGLEGFQHVRAQIEFELCQRVFDVFLLCGIFSGHCVSLRGYFLMARTLRIITNTASTAATAGKMMVSIFMACFGRFCVVQLV